MLQKFEDKRIFVFQIFAASELKPPKIYLGKCLAVFKTHSKCLPVFRNIILDSCYNVFRRTINFWIFFIFWASCWNHCLAALDLRTGVEQPFNCLIVQNRQAVQSMGRSMDWTLEDDMFDRLFFCATLTGRRGGHTPFVQAGAETSHTGAEAVKPDPGFSWEGHSEEGGCRCRGWKCGVLWGCPSTPHSTGNPPTAPHACCCCQINWWDVVRRVEMDVSILGAVRLH